MRKEGFQAEAFQVQEREEEERELPLLGLTTPHCHATATVCLPAWDGHEEVGVNG